MKWTKVLLTGTENGWGHLPDGTILGFFQQIRPGLQPQVGLMLPVWLGVYLQRQTEGSPYISSSLDRKQNEKQVKS